MTIQTNAVIILAAGKGSRLKSALPKPLHCIGNRPMLLHVLDDVAQLPNIAEIVVVVAPDDAITPQLLATEFPKVKTTVQPQPLGTGHAFICGVQALAQTPHKALMLYGDELFMAQDVLAQSLFSMHDVCYVARFEANPKRFGRMVVGEGDLLQRIVEFNDATDAEKAIKLVNTGFMSVLGEGLLQRLHMMQPQKNGEYYVTDLATIVQAQGKTVGYVVAPSNEAAGANTRADLAELEAIFQTKKRAALMAGGVTMQDPASVFVSWDTVMGQDVVLEPNVYIGPNVTIANNVRIKAFSHLEGCTIGQGCQIGPFARIRPGSDFAENVKIGNFVETKNAKLAAGIKANHLAYVSDVTVCEKTNIGAGVIFANYDGYNKYTSHVGANVMLGCNAVVVSPVSIGDNAMVAAGSVITADIAADDLAIARAEQKNVSGAAKRFKEKAKAKKESK
jgi:bifunctional UDP-N-acetylglucosamine pyrophosphorylase / glucosamine-1-phosphate N-acetyltransferase